MCIGDSKLCPDNITTALRIPDYIKGECDACVALSRDACVALSRDACVALSRSISPNFFEGRKSGFRRSGSCHVCSPLPSGWLKSENKSLAINTFALVVLHDGDQTSRTSKCSQTVRLPSFRLKNDCHTSPAFNVPDVVVYNTGSPLEAYSRVFERSK